MLVSSNSKSTSFDQTRANFSRAGKDRTQAFKQLQFFQVIQNYAKRHPVKLNVPDTLVQGFGVKKPTCIRTNSHGLVVSREGLSSPDIINLLLVFSSQSKPGLPCAIAKQELAGRDVCQPLINLKAGQIAWNRTLSQFQPILIQRYIYNGTPCSFILRVTYQPPLNHLAFRVLQNLVSVSHSPDIDPYIELNDFLDKSGRVKQRMGRTGGYSNAGRFCVRTSLLHSFEMCQIPPIDSVKSQVETLRYILEREFLSQHDLSVLELEADFCQDADAKWYFISLHNYKTELMMKRKIPLSDVQLMMSRLVQTHSHLQISRGSFSPSVKIPERLKLGAVLDLTEDMLLSEILGDLGVRKARFCN